MTHSVSAAVPGEDAAPPTLAHAFAQSAAQFADRLAMKPLEGAAIDYRTLERRVRVAIGVLRRQGLQTGDRVAIYLPNSVDWAVLTYACSLLGLCLVPVNTRYRTEELAYALARSEARLVFTQTRFLSNDLLQRLRDVAGGRFGPAGAPVPALPRLAGIVLMDDTQAEGTLGFYALAATAAPADEPLAELAAQRTGDEPLWLFWTSGTTSKPKAALMPQSTIRIVWQWTRLVGYRPDDRVLMSRPLFYIAGHFWSMLGPMLHGACSIVGNRFSTEEMVELCRDQKVTVLSGNPMMFKRLIQDPSFDRSAFADVRLGYFSGSALPVEEMRCIHDAIGYQAMIQTYGMTELGGFIMSTLPSDPIEVACASCGTPFTEIDLRLVDPDSGLDVADGEVGLLLTRGQKLIGYLNLPEAERARFYDADGWYRTGDLMRRLPDGRYQLVGRSKDLIKVSGENVTAAEIEDTLMLHPNVSLAAVIARPDLGRGEVPVAFVELRADDDTTLDELPAWSKSHMAPFKVPAEFHAMQASDWPMTATGKIAKHELAALVPAQAVA